MTATLATDVETVPAVTELTAKEMDAAWFKRFCGDQGLSPAVTYWLGQKSVHVDFPLAAGRPFYYQDYPRGAQVRVTWNGYRSEPVAIIASKGMATAPFALSDDIRAQLNDTTTFASIKVEPA